MAKFLLLSLLIMSVAIPMHFAKRRAAKRALREMIIAMSIYIWLWFLFCVYVYAKLPS